MQFDVRGDVSKIERRLNALQRDLIPLSVVQGLNKALVSVRSEAVKQVAEATGLKQKTVRDKIDLVRATRQTMMGKVDARKGRATNLIELVPAHRQNPRSFRTRDGRGRYKWQGVEAKAWGKSRVYRGTFIGSGKGSGKPLVYARTGPGRNAKLKAIAGPSIRKEFIRAKVQESLRRLGRQRFRTEFIAALRYNISSRR